jgi:hypothetical protein
MSWDASWPLLSIGAKHKGVDRQIRRAVRTGGPVTAASVRSRTAGIAVKSFLA